MATVYEGRSGDGERVAIKILHADLAGRRRARRRFLREAIIANRVRHPGIVPIIEADVTEGTPYLVMELLEGKTLRERCEEGRLALDEVLRVAEAVLEVLAAAHEQGIVHRDIKPANVLVTPDGLVKVLDFGIAHVLDEELADELSATRSGMTVGTPAFLPPEQARGRSADVDERTDVWAVGALMFSLLTGRYVHEAETPNEQMILAATQPAPLLLARAPALPRSVGEIVDRALRMDKKERWQTARAMEAAVRLVRSSAVEPEGCKARRPSAEMTVSESDRTAPSARRFHPSLRTLGISAVAAMLAGGVLLLGPLRANRRPQDPGDPAALGVVPRPSNTPPPASDLSRTSSSSFAHSSPTQAAGETASASWNADTDTKVSVPLSAAIPSTRRLVTPRVAVHGVSDASTSTSMPEIGVTASARRPVTVPGRRLLDVHDRTLDLRR